LPTRPPAHDLTALNRIVSFPYNSGNRRSLVRKRNPADSKKLQRRVHCMKSWPALFVSLVLPGIGFCDDWPEFRGPTGQGHSAQVGLPVRWSETENVRWKVAVPGKGWSSPVLKGSQIWLTTAADEGRSLRAVCLDRETGRIVQNVEVLQKNEPGPIHPKNSHASPTPILENDRVYVHFGSHGTACLSTRGEIVWRTTLNYYHRHGPGGSPALVGDLLVVSCDGYDSQFIVALDKRTGAERWRRPRPDGRHAYSTPLTIQVNGRTQVISTGGNRVTAYDPSSGEEIWWSRYDGYSLIPRPVFGHDLVFICSGYETPLIYAIRPIGSGDVTETHVAWSLRQGAPHTPSPILVGRELYTVSDAGVAQCLDAATGKVHWRMRLGGGFSASPVFADGKLYFLNEEGVTTVLAPGTQFQKRAVNRIDGRTLASLAVADKALYLRSDAHLYRIENR
jgi:outer membrane protein assembly factor BamB